RARGLRHGDPDRHRAGGAVHRVHRRQHGEHGGARADGRDRGAEGARLLAAPGVRHAVRRGDPALDARRAARRLRRARDHRLPAPGRRRLEPRARPARQLRRHQHDPGAGAVPGLLRRDAVGRGALVRRRAAAGGADAARGVLSVFLPLRYPLANLAARRTRTLLTVGVVALVVVATTLFSGLVSSLKRTLVATGHERNLIVLRKGSTNDGSSSLPLEAFQALRFFEGVARGPDGQPLASPELVVQPFFRTTSGGRENVPG